MTPYSLLALLLSFVATLYAIPKWIYRAKKAGLTGKDLHKRHNDEIPEVGGLPIMFGFLAGILVYIAFKVFIYEELTYLHILYAAVASILIAALIGLVDDILGWKIGLRQFQKAIVTLGIAMPMVVINAGNSAVNIPFIGNLDFGLLYPLIIIPLGIMFTSNAFNMLAGYNGLEAGMGIIILFTLSFISYVSGSYWVAILGLCMVAALIAFMFYNVYPAKLFPGDTMTYSIGALIGIMAVLANIEKFAILLFSLYIVQFFLKARGMMQKESFGKLNSDCSLKEPYTKIYALEHIIIKLLRSLKKKAYEWEVTLILLSTQLIIAAVTIAYYYA